MKTTGEVVAIIANLVTVKSDSAVSQNEICYIDCQGVPLMAEVIKITGENVFVQVFESTRGLMVGAKVTFEGHLLEATLGPGILTRIYDGLQNDLKAMEGVFLQRGDYTPALDMNAHWDFTPLASGGDTMCAGDWLGWVPEGWLEHKIMVPFALQGQWTIEWIASAGNYSMTDHIAVLVNSSGEHQIVTMVQKWPVKVPITSYI
ncbi:MAG: V-type ATP synthase subunit A, partial [Mucinivorans sp.]